MSPIREASTVSGPSSRTRSAPSAATTSVKRTVSRTCETQYSGSSQRPAVATRARGAWNVSVRTTWRNSSSIGSISDEWNAWLVRRRVVFQPWASISAMSDSWPATTMDDGPLTAAMSMRGKLSTTDASDAWTASITPPGGRACINRARAETSFAASAREKTSAANAAAISPIEWPAKTSAVTPHDRTRASNATSTAKIFGCAQPVWSGSRSGISNRAETSSKASANTGKAA